MARPSRPSAASAAYYIIPNISITGELSGIQMPDIFENYDGHYADLDIYGTFNFTKNIGAQFGYRSFDVGCSSTTTPERSWSKGVYFGVVARY